MVITILPYPIALALSGQTKTGGNFLAWQLVRQPNHSLAFYLTAVPPAIGLGVVGLAALSLIARARSRRWTWRETLVACWIGVPIAFLELWPVKGFQYLLPLAPVVAVLAADGLAIAGTRRSRASHRVRVARARPLLVAILLGSLAVPTYAAVAPVVAHLLPRRLGRRPGRPRDGPLHPGARARGRDDADDRPVDGEHPRVLRPPAAPTASSVSPNRSHRNPIYKPVSNPDLCAAARRRPVPRLGRLLGAQERSTSSAAC